MTDASYTPPLTSEPQDPPRPAGGGPALWAPDPETDRRELERVNREAGYYEASDGLALRESFTEGWEQIGARTYGYLVAENERAIHGERTLSAEEATERFGVAGRLQFDAPIDESWAAWRQSLAQRRAFREEVYANADVPLWQLMGANMIGSLLDPAGIPLWLAPELAAGRWLEGGVAASRLSRLGPIGRGAVRGAVEGVAGGVLYEGANLWLHHQAADDYDFGQASANVIFGGLLGGVIGAGGGWWESRGQAPRAPRAVADLDETSRLGAFAEAMDAVIEDRPVDLGPSLAREAEARAQGRVLPEALRGLDENRGGIGGADFGLAGARFDEAVAVTPRGEEVPVRFAVVEADDLITSHDDDLYRNPDYPAALQPRQRDRAGAIARNRALEAELNPKRLMRDVGAETGAPIVARDGVVESGNGRSIAIRRSYRTGTDAAKRYRAELKAQGFDVEGLRQPVLVRERTSVLDGQERVKLTRDMNAEATEAYSPSERASADAGAIDDDLLGLIEGADMNAAGNRRFVRGFLDKVAADDLNRMTTADGRLSEAGLDRINAALVARAYGDRGLVEALFEATDNNIKAIGKALAEAAPEWAAMRAAMQRGEVPAELDPTEALKAAVAFVRHVRARKGSIEESMDLIIGQADAFSGAAMTVETEAFVRAFFRTSKDGDTLWKSPRSASSLAEGLRWLAGEARKAQPGPNLFGDVADESTGRQLLDGLGRWFARQGDEGHPLGDDLFRTGPDGNERAQPAPADAGGDVRPPVVETGRVAGGQGAGGEAEKPRIAKGETPPPPKGEPFADPDIADLADDTAQMLAREGLEAASDGPDPQTVADAVTAAAFCLRGGQ